MSLEILWLLVRMYEYLDALGFPEEATGCAGSRRSPERTQGGVQLQESSSVKQVQRCGNLLTNSLIKLKSITVELSSSL